MKFCWLPWYNTIIQTKISRIEVMESVRMAVHHDDWEESSSIYLGYVYNRRFEIFFRKTVGRRNSWMHSKEEASSKKIILLAEVLDKNYGCDIKLSIFLNWFLSGFLVILFVILPIVGVFATGEWRLLVIPVIAYSICLIWYNLFAFNLYYFFYKLFKEDII